MKNLILFLLPLALLAGAQPGLADPPLPDLTESTASLAYTGPEMCTLLIVPDGSGPNFTEAVSSNGYAVDATITLVVLDSFGEPTFEGYPNESLWLEFPGGVPFPNCAVPTLHGLMADFPANGESTTQWFDPPQAGGYNEGPTIVCISETPLQSNAGLPLRFNSPDINGDLIVGLADIQIFVRDYYSGDYHFRSDLFCDGDINLSDIPPMARSKGINCQ